MQPKCMSSHLTAGHDACRGTALDAHGLHGTYGAQEAANALAYLIMTPGKRVYAYTYDYLCIWILYKYFSCIPGFSQSDLCYSFTNPSVVNRQSHTPLQSF